MVLLSVLNLISMSFPAFVRRGALVVVVLFVLLEGICMGTRFVFVCCCICNDWFDFDLWCCNAAFSNISAISWRSVLVVGETGVPGENHRPLVNFMTCDCESSALFCFHKAGCEPTPYELLGNPTTYLFEQPGPFVFVGVGTHVVFVLFVFSYS